MKELIKSIYEQAKALSESGDVLLSRAKLLFSTADALQKQYDASLPPVVIPEPEPELPACKKIPTIVGISKITDSSLILNFDALGVEDLWYWIAKDESTQAIFKSSVMPKSASIPLSFPKQLPGAYYLAIEGKNCKSPVSYRKFTIEDKDVIVVPPPVDNGGNNGTVPPPVQNSKGRLFIMNTTGHGFDIHDPTGIRDIMREQADAWVSLEFNGKKVKGADVLRLNAKWFDYEPTEGQYRDDKLLAAQKWCKDRKLMLSVDLVPWRKQGDNMFKDYDKARLSNGEIWTENPTLNRDTYIPSMNSDVFHQKWQKTVEHMASVLSRDPDWAYSMYMTTAQSEEFQMIRQENPLLITGYGDVDKDKWKTYSGGKDMPPVMTRQEQLDAYMATPVGKMFYEFQTKALKETHAAFVRGVHKGGLLAGGMYAGAGAGTAVFNFTFKLNEMFSAGTADQPDIIYSSEGDENSQWTKLMATDLNMGTFKGARCAIEFDHEDVAWNQNDSPPRDEPINPGIVYDWVKAFWQRGGDDVHWAMDYLPQVIRGFAEPLWKLRNEDIPVGVAQGEKIVFPVTRYFYNQEYRGKWQENGGSREKQVLIELK